MLFKKLYDFLFQATSRLDMYAEELSNAVKPDYKPHVIREGDKWINDNKARRTGQCILPNIVDQIVHTPQKYIYIK